MVLQAPGQSVALRTVKTFSVYPLEGQTETEARSTHDSFILTASSKAVDLEVKSIPVRFTGRYPHWKVDKSGGQLK